MIEQELYDHLVAQVPSVGGRVFANIMHQDTTKPAMVYTVVSETQEVPFSGDCTESEVSVEWVIHLYHDEYMANKTIKNEVKAALLQFGHGIDTITVEDGYDIESELFVQIIQFNTKES